MQILQGSDLIFKGIGSGATFHGFLIYCLSHQSTCWLWDGDDVPWEYLVRVLNAGICCQQGRNGCAKLGGNAVESVSLVDGVLHTLQ